MLMPNILITSTRNKLEGVAHKITGGATQGRVQYPLKKYYSYYEGSQSEDGDIGSPYQAS